ncbi:hypothetical protein A2803_04485 [Candidatus Woesebacteria bacterium RIFCSPHIGHO2_01_FULL_44_21]|uniref:SipW-cognate class signal peptide n=1 Tax=Candidatus Woesebacteria bacterium RIFCSPHIGHO2_01_FULL_44_21 TaxID=1802503 RepID=A0A1F7YY53_9BACT|nr:MAG: hypothetical protein A2803_04485 [Candidatus Woesebacteria bacterium RIFCSPHIGHO2_01_FULL_44_21]OGM71329.1 MAG: hypothetical protein A2897_00850 [Candidatus Woesebacteria bacterium RIFCSPLOWO2_01_FULL_44_24b]
MINLKKIILSFITVLVAGGVVIAGTNAFFSDTEESKGNVLAAGAIDLGVDNHSYYNGLLNPGTTWRVDYDLDPLLGDDPSTPNVVETDFVIEPGRLFFDFHDLKPGDWGEDTISLHVKDNDSWLCADVTLTSDDDNGLTEPEGDDGDITPGPLGEGELADHVNFYWWADDGDNVFECVEEETPEGIVCNPRAEGSEHLLPAGPIGALNVGETAHVALADSLTNIWGDQGPLPGGEVRFVAKAWCFGTTEMTPYPQDGGNQQSGPDDRPVLCDGSAETNVTQTDSLTADIAFRAVQSRHNDKFLCRPELAPPTGP